MKIDQLKKIFEFPILWEGWECDSTAWIAEDKKGNRFLIMTNHGCEYIAKPAELQNRIEEYQRVIGESEKALEELKGKAA